MQKTPNQKGFTKKVKRVCSFKTFNASKREKLKQKLGSVEKGKTIDENRVFFNLITTRIDQDFNYFVPHVLEYVHSHFNIWRAHVD